MVGLEIAAALGVIGGDSEAILEVLHKITKADIQNAKDYVKDHVKVSLKDTEKKLYIEVEVRTSDDSAQVIIEDSHTNITRIQHGAFTIFEKSHCRDIGETGHGNSSISVEEIYHFIENVNAEKLGFLKETISLNWDIAQEGISGEYGLSVGRSIYESQISGGQEYRPNTQEYAAALTAAAADARMAGCKLPVMTVCGSGNQGITATVPVIAVARKEKYSEELLYKAVALSCLITTHVKKYIGKLSPLCGCGMGSSIGVCCALIICGVELLSRLKAVLKI